MGASVIRVNVSIPQTLKEKMDSVKEAVNWSAVATAAFEHKLLELQSRKGGMDMKDVIERMRAAEKLEANSAYQDGKRAGEQWAKTQATPRQLRRLEKLDEAGSLDDPDGDYIGVRIFDAINPDGSGYDAAFWAGALGDDAGRIDDYDFARGFKDGAIELWLAVEDQL